jgi:LacI family transcriptional regulator
MATLRDIAHRAGVSMATASRALTGHPDTGDETRRRIEQIAEELGYKPNAIARSLRRKQNATVGLMVPDVRNSFYASAATAIEQTLSRRGYRVWFALHHDSRELEAQHLQTFLEEQVAGMLVVPSQTTGLTYRWPKTTPLVLFARTLQQAQVDSVVCEDLESARLATEHLLSLGHHRIGLVCGLPAATTTRQRLEGYRQALSGAGLEADPELILVRDYTSEWGYEAAQRLLDCVDRVTAVFAAGNRLVIGALRALSERKLSIGRDVSVLGFGDPELFASLSPPITTVAQPWTEMARAAADLLVSRMELSRDGPRDSVSHVQLTFASQLVVRASTAPPRPATKRTRPARRSA